LDGFEESFPGGFHIFLITGVVGSFEITEEVMDYGSFFGYVGGPPSFGPNRGPSNGGVG
jgi:hypothetical protein